MRIVGLGVVCVVAAAAMMVQAQGNGETAAKTSRVFEMRTYHAAPGKLDALHARFRNHTARLFEKHGMTNIAYWVPIDGTSGKPTSETIVYILAYPSLEARRQAWDAFGKDPAWVKAKAESEAAGRLVERVESVFLTATDYSPIE